MNLRQVVDELQQNLGEIEKQERLVRLRRILKFVIVGFLIGRHSKKRISELSRRNSLLIDRLLKSFRDLQAEGRIEKLASACELLSDLERRVAALAKESALPNSLRNMAHGLKKLREIAVQSVQEAIRHKEQAVKIKIDGIVNSGTYLVFSEKQESLQGISSLEKVLKDFDQAGILKDEFLRERHRRLVKYRQTVLDYNRAFVQQRKKDYGYLWNKDLLSLDDEQQTAIVTDDKHNLVVAAAGSGKTEVLITRIAYLIARKPDTIQPKRILAIAYQRKAREEIEQRLQDRYNIGNVQVRTFHKLGKDILEEAGRHFMRADIVNENKKHEIIQKIFKQKIKDDPQFYELFLRYVKTLHDKEKREDEEVRDETLAYARERAYYSINNVQVSSLAEKEIMDFLLTRKLNGQPIVVRYEPDMEGFRPDFHLPQHDLFIEHWALDKEGKVPKWFKQTSEVYRKAMGMKKKWFAEHGKMLVETFAYEYNPKSPNQFLELLRKRIVRALKTRGDGEFEFTLRTYNEIVAVAWQSYRTPIDDIVSFITTAKTYGLTPQQVEEKLEQEKWTPKQVSFGNLVLPVFSTYGEVLQEHKKIDFEDMINQAIEELGKDPNMRANVYDHILIDEYQDISSQRYRLLKRLMTRNPSCKLFCVGDDWQSIMGFSGSNLNFFVNFKEYFDNPAVTTISTNYRSNKTIVDAGADLIKNNKRCQIQKPTTSSRRDLNPIKVLRSPHKEGYQWNYHRQTAEDCLNRIDTLMENGYSPKDILVLSRCMRTRFGRGYRFIANVRTLLDMAKDNGVKLAYDRKEAGDEVRLLTAHRSKGLEAKVVFLLNVTKGMYGFPCEIEDPSILEPAREDYPPQDQREEERRLFYVAMTRAMEDLYIYTWEPAMSDFLEEISDYTIQERLSY